MKSDNFNRLQADWDRRMDIEAGADDYEPLHELPIDAIESRLDNMQTWRERPI